MKTEIIKTTESKSIAAAIKSTPKTWYEMPLDNLPLYPNFTRSLAVSGFLTPDMEDSTEDRIYVNVRQYLHLKETGELYKSIKMKNWEITEANNEDVIGSDGKVIYDIERVTDDNGDIISEKPIKFTAPSVQYVRFLIATRSIHLVDILDRFMGIYLEKFKSEIDNI